jgi:hydroxyquinol 1,2-dioxygenase
MKGRWYSLQHRFVVMRGEAVVPQAPITGKVQGERAETVVLEGTQRTKQT